ncbi:MAG: M1 family metallopeptidase [Bacteroidota bacterium]
MKSLFTYIWLLALLPLIVLASCQAPDADSMQSLDPHSFAQPQEARVSHLDLDITVNFTEERIEGTAVLTVDKAQDANRIILDTKGLIIQRVSTSENRLDTKTANYGLGEEDPILGQALIVDLPQEAKFVHINYQTTPGAEALQFLPPELTAAKKAPFLLTQSQAILARSWVPIQDSPGIRFTYNATVQVPKGLMALMSAENPTEVVPDGIYAFSMPQPIPAYLLALAVGEVEFLPIGTRTGVYAEPNVINDAAYEFGEMEAMLELAEELYGPYRWGRYDVIVLPPSFPFGGMENPRLTFATPTILAGDRSLVSLIAHELAHSWSGNLVTNASWNDFWLNEGFTVYFENRIMEALKGREYSEMLAQISYEDLIKEIQDMGFSNPDTRLAIELSERNPDDGMTSIAYDKGYYFLRRIEEAVGRETFDHFLKQYFTEHAFKSMNTEGFLAYLDQHLLQNHPAVKEQIDIDHWVYGTGLPDDLPAAQSSRYKAVEDALNSWIAGMKPGQLETAEWSSHEWLHFIRTLPDSMSTADLTELDKAFALTQSTNSEVQCAWYITAVNNAYQPAYPAMERFLRKVGRRKFINPIYKALIQTEAGAQTARRIYAEARGNYHPIAVMTLDKLLNWEE